MQPPLIAIDGLSCSGKGTLVSKLKERVDLDCIELDDLYYPKKTGGHAINRASHFSSSGMMCSWRQ